MVALGFSASSAQAAVVIYSGYDLGASAPGANTSAAQSSFLAATGATETIDFEKPLSANVSITGGNVLSTPPGASQFWGSNVTPGGSYYLSFTNNVVFDFITPISSFGLIMGGLQGPNTIKWTNALGLQQISVAQPGGSGFAFLGFTDFGQSITSVTVSSLGDTDGLDDVRFGFASASAVPEPMTWALMLIGFGFVGAALRQGKQSKQTVRFSF